MIFKRIIIAAIFCCCNLFCYGQNRNNIWCFGDSAGIDFNSLPTPYTSIARTRGSISSIADSSGQLLFYAAYDTTAIIAGTDPVKVYNKSHVQMANGINMKGGGWYNEIIIITDPISTDLYYLFYIGVTLDYGFYYAKVDLNLNGGLGAVTQKNIQLQGFANVDCLNAIKHGNGRDWWIFFRRWDSNNPTPNDEFHSYLITPNGITNYTVQHVGSSSYTGLGKLSFSPLGDRLAFVTYAGLVEVYDFDRCTGIISNPTNVFQETTGAGANHFVGCEFSPNNNMLYVTISSQTSYLFQFDLTSPNIAASIDTLWSTSFPGEAIGELKRGPDNKIYESGPYTSSSFFVYPYPDSVYNMYNMNLGVINSPDSLGAACNFQPYSFYLGGKRTYWGLPNNPDYDLPRDSGSVCDTVLWTNSPPTPEGGVKGVLYLTYVNLWDKLFINAQHLKGTTYTLTVTDVMGRQVFTLGHPSTSSGGSGGGYFTKDLDCSSFAKGMYIVTLTTDKEALTQKFIKE